VRNPNRWRPRLEALEDRTLLSATTAPLVAPAAAVSATHHTSQPVQLALAGQANGTWTAPTTRPTVGAVQALTGTGTFAPLGSVQVGVKLTLPSLTKTGRATGTLTVTASGGTLTLSLLGPYAKGFGRAILPLSYQITHGTGRYAGARGSGVVTLAEFSALPTRGASKTVPMFTLAF
jgi:hypothetical protein